MKGIILHGGQGTRLRPLTYAGPKQLIPVANKPVSHYALEDLASSGVRDVAIVLGETFPDMVRDYYGDGSRFNVRITYVHQGSPLGIAHAIGLCRDFVGDDDFIVYLGDNMFQNGIKKYVEYFEKDDPDALILLKEVDEPSRFGVAQLGKNNTVVKIVEKPKLPPSNYAVVGLYFFKPSVFNIISMLKPSYRNELEITDAIQGMIDQGYRVMHSFVEGWWADTGKKDDILALNATVLDERIVRDIKGEVVDSRIEGRVQIDEGCIIKNSTIRGPAIIGRGTSIMGSYVGPHTSIGSSCRISDSSIEYSIVMDGTSINGIKRIEESLIGRNSRLSSNKRENGILKVHVSDYSEIQV